MTVLQISRVHVWTAIAPDLLRKLQLLAIVHMGTKASGYSGQLLWDS